MTKIQKWYGFQGFTLTNNRYIPSYSSKNYIFPTTSGKVTTDWGEWYVIIITKTSNVHVASWVLILVTKPFLDLGMIH